MNLIEEFNKIRDIPYSIPLSIEQTNNSCSWKDLLLKPILENHWFQVKYRVCTFKRSDLKLPDFFNEIPHEDFTRHVYLEVLLNWKWINLDPTWDEWLKNVFNIEYWDGINSTWIAVKPIELFDDEHSNRCMSISSPEKIEKDYSINWKFYKAFNERLEKNRI